MTKKKMPKKGKPKGKKSVGGRRLFDGKNIKDVIQKLEAVWAIDGSDKEAALYADISPAALCDYLKKNPKVSERKEALRNRPVLKARQEVVKGLDKNPEFSLKYLERKQAKEFAPQSMMKHSGDAKEPITYRIIRAGKKR